MTRQDSYDSVAEQLRDAYDRSAAERDATPKDRWKLAERTAFLERLQAEHKTRLLEVGAGTGDDSLFFQQQGMSVIATDLSPKMVERCRAKGLEAHVMDFLHLTFPPGSFEAVYAINALLHVPNAHFPAVLAVIRDLLAPGGLFFLGVYGGEAFEGISPNDWHHPPRFFAFRTDDQLRSSVERYFDVVDFHVIEPESDGKVAAAAGAARFQSFTVRAPRL